MRHGRDAERDAARFLTKKGYKILSYQDRAKYYIRIDDKIEEVNIVADFLVKKNNQIYVVEVKTGEFATSLKSVATRRQLLEYFSAYAPYKILLLDMERGTLRSIEFLFSKKRNIQIIIFYFILGFLIGGVFIYFIIKIR